MDKKRQNKIKGQDRVKKTIKAKDKRGAKKAVGVMQRDYKEEVWKSLLYLWPGGTLGEQLANGTFMGQGIAGGLLEIRFKSVATSVLALQYKLWRNGCRILPPNVYPRRKRIHGKANSRQTGKREGL